MTLTKIISIKNVGRFLNCAASGDVTMKRYTLVFAENGRGKTTLCAILRSLQTNNSAYVTGRRTLGAADPPEIRFLVDGIPASFSNGTWDRTLPHLAIFDGTFVTENVYSGDAVATEQRRNLYRVIIGAQGVGFAQRIEELDGLIRAKNSDIRDAQEPIQREIPSGISLEAFLALAEDATIDDKISVAEREIGAARQAEQIRQRAGLTAVIIPALPGAFPSILNKTLVGVVADAEQRVVEHMRAHDMAERGEPWLAEGLRYVHADACPFCGQSIAGLTLVDAYKAYFSEAYDALRAEISSLTGEIGTAFNDRELSKIDRTFDQNAAVIEFWRPHADFSIPLRDAAENIVDALVALRQAALGLLQRKLAAPLENLPLDAAYTQAEGAVAKATASVTAYNTLVTAANAAIAARKDQTGAANLTDMEAGLTRLKATKIRYTPTVRPTCENYQRLSGEKGGLEAQKAQTRQQLDEHTGQVIEQYGQSINRYLDRFNAGFRITTPSYTYRGGPPSSSYQILINNVPIDLGDGSTPLDRPSFRNTLSAGDRSTLALAFFLAQLEQDPNRATTTVVLDDPFTSQDNFRRSHTAYQIKRCGEVCGQVVLLSHDPTFLKLVWDKLAPPDRKALQLVRVREENTTIAEWDIEKAVQARYRADVETLQRHYALGEGDPRDVIQKIRPVLEGFCRNLYPSQFLGTIVGKIRTAGAAHPLYSLADDLDEINEYCRRYHHAESPSAGTDPIDDNELRGYVKRTLALAGCF